MRSPLGTSSIEILFSPKKSPVRSAFRRLIGSSNAIFTKLFSILKFSTLWRALSPSFSNTLILGEVLNSEGIVNFFGTGAAEEEEF